MVPGPNSLLAIMIVACWCAAVVSYAMCQWLAKAMILPDRPNRRSSHTSITPRAGGIAIYSAWSAAMLVMAIFFKVTGTPSQILSFAAIASLAFLLGAFDDANSLSPNLKLLGQMGIALIFCVVFGAIEAVPVPFVGEVELGPFGVVLTVFWIVAFMNAFNFMDGLNGLASVAAVFVLCAISVMAALTGVSAWSICAIVMAVAIGGFAPLNLRKGTLFMGDNGSMLIGFVIAALGVQIANESAGQMSFLFVPMAFLPFLFDVAFTIGHRAYRRERVQEAHREHVYQLLNRLGRSHAKVTAIYAAMIVLSSSAAMLMISLAPSLQWFVPLVFAAGLLSPALAVYRKARAAKLLQHKRSIEGIMIAPNGDEVPGAILAQAAE